MLFRSPTAIAALSNATATGFRLSGSWRQQFDWAVLEWNRDNVFEHPSLRYLPDGDLSGLSLSYEESRIGCIPIDSDLFPTVDWPYLRIWADEDGAESLYFVSLRDNATPVEGSYQPAYAEFTLSGSPVSGSYVGIANADQHFTYQVYAGHSVGAVVQAIADSINAFSTSLRASVSSATLRVFANTGVNGNRLAVYSYVSGTTSVAWDSVGQTLRYGASPTRWRVALNFANLIDRDGHRVPTERVRKMRWTYAADLQDGDFQRTAFQLLVSNWSVTGQGRNYLLAGPGSRRIEQSDGSVVYTGSWVEERGNYSGGSIQIGRAHV